MSLTGQLTRRTSDSAPAGRVQAADRKPGPAKASEQPKMPPRKTWPWFLLVLVANYWLMRFLIPGPEEPLTVPYTVFKDEVAKATFGNCDMSGFARQHFSALKRLLDREEPDYTR